ncbi:MAG: hypothetical protein JSV13_08140 [Nitrospiraceae bacterium]|nr:MAG: hypothetical protein JSV13_08140 [Nitrospiraceae bacterium]
MKKFSWRIWIGILLVSLSIFFYVVHYFIFRDSHHIFVFMLHDIAFVPLEVLFVTLIIERLLHHREKQSLLKKLNMLVGAFFSEVGKYLISYCSQCTGNHAVISRHFHISTDWTDSDFASAHGYAAGFDPSIECTAGDLEALRDFLVTKRGFLLALLKNPNLLEHESFTNLLWATFHLSEELEAREDIDGLPESDLRHLAGDIKRAYGQLIMQWLDYMKHLKHDYPYLYSLSVRTNPFRKDASPVVTK